jgi:hypothetical protein
MKLIVSPEFPKTFILKCPCGFTTQPAFTLEWAGRQADLHMAERFPKGTIRRPCDAPPVLRKTSMRKAGIEPAQAFAEGQKILRDLARAVAKLEELQL